MHFTNDIGKSKVVSAEESLTALNPDTQVIAYRERLTASNVLGIIQNYDVVLGCAGNFSTKFLLNDVCIMAGKPLFFCAVSRFVGQALTILPGMAVLSLSFSYDAAYRHCIVWRASGCTISEPADCEH